MTKFRASVTITHEYEFEFDFDGDEDEATSHVEALCGEKSMEELGADLRDGRFEVWDITEVPMTPTWVIRHTDHPDHYWSTAYCAWVELDSATEFNPHGHEYHPLPLGGEWVLHDEATA